MIYVFLADGFEETEALTTVDILRRGGCEVNTVSIDGESVIKSSHNIGVIADIGICDISKDNLEGIVLPGGMPGTLNLDGSEVIKEYVGYCVDSSLVIGAICAGPSILGKMGVLKGKKSTCFPGFENYLEGSDFTGEYVVTDGNIVTAKGMGSTILFGIELLKLFKNEEIANNVYSSLQYPCVK